MVDPVSNDERARTLLYAKVATALLVGASAGLITTQGEASTEVVVGAVAGGLVLGAALAWYLFPDAGDAAPGSERSYGK